MPSCPAQRCTELGVENAIGTPTQIDRHKPERLVHRHIAVSGAYDATPLTQRLVKGFSQADKGVLGSVMLVHMQVATGFHRQVEESVTGKEREHVVEKREFPCRSRHDHARRCSRAKSGFRWLCGQSVPGALFVCSPNLFLLWIIPRLVDQRCVHEQFLAIVQAGAPGQLCAQSA